MIFKIPLIIQFFFQNSNGKVSLLAKISSINEFCAFYSIPSTLFIAKIINPIFLAATGQLYKRVCRSVGRSVGLFHLAFLASFGAVAAYEVLTSLVFI